jgi:hypothetical protein
VLVVAILFVIDSVPIVLIKGMKRKEGKGKKTQYFSLQTAQVSPTHVNYCRTTAKYLLILKEF